MTVVAYYCWKEGGRYNQKRLITALVGGGTATDIVRQLPLMLPVVLLLPIRPGVVLRGLDPHGVNGARVRVGIAKDGRQGVRPAVGQPPVDVRVVAGDAPGGEVDVAEAEVGGEQAGDEDVVDPEVGPAAGDGVQVADDVRRHDDAPAAAVPGVVLLGVLLQGKLLLLKKEHFNP